MRILQPGNRQNDCGHERCKPKQLAILLRVFVYRIQKLIPIGDKFLKHGKQFIIHVTQNVSACGQKATSRD